MKDKENIEITILIDKYIKGELSQEEIDDLWIKFLENPEYYDLFETDLHLRSLAKKGVNPFEEDSTGSGNESIWSNYKTWAYAAAAAVTLALLLQLFTIGQPDSAAELAITSIEQNELTGADVLRSDEEDASDINISINRALSMAYSDETENAIESFEVLLEQPLNEEQRFRVEMNLGILHYNNTEYPTARNYFTAILERDELPVHIEEKAWWFLGNTYLNLNELEEARDAVYNTYVIDGRFQTPALALLKRLDIELGNIGSDVERLNTN